MIKKLSIIIIGALLPSALWSAPSISGVTGSLADGQTITITGSGFGSTGPTILLFDDFELGSDGTPLSDSERNAQVGVWRQISQIDPYYPTYSGTYAHSGSLAFKQDWGSGPGEQEGARWASPKNSSVFSTVYMSFWIYVPAGKDIPGTSQGIPNWKIFWLSTDDYFQNDYTSTVLTNSIPDTTGNYYFGTSVGNGSQDRAGIGWKPLYLTKGRWARQEKYLVASTSSGYLQDWYMDSSRARYSVGTANGRTIDNGTTGWQYIHFPGFGRYDSNSQTYYDDIYVATGPGALARVEIGNASTYSSCTNLAVCTPTSWSNTSIDATVRAGSFSSGTAYLYVIDSEGAVSTAKEITLGEEEEPPADTTPPAVTITTSDPQSISTGSVSISWTDSDDTGVTSRKWRIGSAPDADNGTECTSPATITGLSVGSNTVYIGAGDAAGNWGSDSITVNYNPVVYRHIGGSPPR